jgi:hypothetical protein
MKAVLARIEARIYWIDEDGKEHEGAPSDVSGDLSGVSGDLSEAEINQIHTHLCELIRKTSRLAARRPSADPKEVPMAMLKACHRLKIIFGDTVSIRESALREIAASYGYTVLEARAALPREEPTRPDLQAIAPDEMEEG